MRQRLNMSFRNRARTTKRFCPHSMCHRLSTTVVQASPAQRAGLYGRRQQLEVELRYCVALFARAGFRQEDN